MNSFSWKHLKKVMKTIPMNLHFPIEFSQSQYKLQKSSHLIHSTTSNHHFCYIHTENDSKALTFEHHKFNFRLRTTYKTIPNTAQTRDLSKPERIRSSTVILSAFTPDFPGNPDVSIAEYVRLAFGGFGVSDLRFSIALCVRLNVSLYADRMQSMFRDLGCHLIISRDRKQMLLIVEVWKLYIPFVAISEFS